MATIIKIKNSGTTGKPSVLATGEFGYSYLSQLPIEGLVTNNNGDRLFIGTGEETDGEAASVVHVGGKYYMDMLDHQNGIVTANSALIVDSNKSLNELIVDTIKIDSDTISATSGDLHLTAVSGQVFIDSDIDLTNINVDTIGSSRVDGDIFIEPGSTGLVQFSSENSIRLPVGSTATRDASPLQGMVRYNVTTTMFEGYDGNGWVALNGLVDSYASGQNTKITAENSTGANNDQLRMYTGGTERVRIEDSGETMFSDNLGDVAPVGTQIKNNKISTFGSDILFLDPSTGGSNTGSVVIEGNLTIKGTTTTSNSASTQSEDPTIILGISTDSDGDEIPLTTNDGLDKGIEFRWYGSGTAKSGFFGYDNDQGRFTFIKDATNTSNVFSGAASDVTFGNALLDSITITTSNFTDNSVGWFDTDGDMQFAGGDALSPYNSGAFEGQVLQMSSAGIPVFAHIDCGTY